MANGSETGKDKSESEEKKESREEGKEAGARREEERDEQEGSRTKGEKGQDEKKQLVEKLKGLDKKRKELRAQAEAARAEDRARIQDELYKVDREYFSGLDQARRQVLGEGTDEKLNDATDVIKKKYDDAVHQRKEPLDLTSERQEVEKAIESQDLKVQVRALLVEERIENREEEYKKAVETRQGNSERGRVDEGSMNKLAEMWEAIQEKKDEIQVDESDKAEAAKARRELSHLKREEDKVFDLAEKVDPQIREYKEELEDLKQDAKDLGGLGQFMDDLEEMIEESVEQEKGGGAEAKLRTAYLRREGEGAIEELSRTTEGRDYTRRARELEETRRDLTRRLINKEISQEEFQAESQRLGQEAHELRDEAALEMGARGQMYERMPKQGNKPDKDYEDELEIWVWKKIRAIDSASISPSALVYSPAYTSLLYALTEANLPVRLKKNINAWRNVYEIGLIWDASGRPEDVLARAADLDSDAFLGLIGQYVRDKNDHIVYVMKDGKKVPVYTEQAKAIQKAFAALDENGYKFTHGSTNKSRDDLHAEIAEGLEKDLPEKHKNLGLGTVYERIAYRYWKILGREGRFDRVTVKADRDMTLDKDNFVWVYRTSGEGENAKTERIKIKHGEQILRDDLVTVSEAGDEIVSRKKINKKYDGYSKTSVKFWYRRIVGEKSRRSEGIRQEKNIRFVRHKLDAISYDIVDFLSDSVKVKGEATEGGGLENADGAVELIKVTALQEADWENNTGTYGVWIDNLRKAAETRKFAIDPNGPLDRPDILDPRIMMDYKKVNDTYGDKENTIHERILEGDILAHKKRFLPRIGDQGDDLGFRISWTEVQDETGTSYEPLDGSGIEEYIDLAVKQGFITARAGEELKRRYLGFLGLPGYGPVRFTGRAVEAAPRSILGILFAMLGKFFEVALPPEAGLGGGGKRR